MLSHDEMIGLQAEGHYLIKPAEFRTKEEFVLHLIHSFAYESAGFLSNDKRTLDFGCNTGYGTNIVNASCANICGVDVSSDAIDEAENIYGKNGIDFKVIDGKSLPFSDGHFERILSFQVLEHIVDHKAYISEIKRTLGQDGVVIFTTPNKEMRLDVDMKPWNEFHVREYTYKELEDLLLTFFPFAKVLGLFAVEDLYQIESDRLNKAKINARNSNEIFPDKSGSFRETLKKLLPKAFLKFIRKLLNTIGTNSPDVRLTSLEPDFIQKYSTSDFHYSDKNISESLDLIAVCTESQKELDESINLLLKR